MNSQRILRASIADLTFGIWAVVVPTLFGRRLVNGDGDMARHVAMGEHMLRNGWIERDLFSFTRAGEPFLAKEWLGQIVYALFDRVGGIAGVAIGAGLVIAATYALTVLFMRRRGVDPLLAYLTGMAAAVLGSAHWLARPHLFTLAGVTILLFLIECPSAREEAPTPFDWRRRVWFFAPLFLVWANLHAGFIIGFAILTVYIAGDLIEAFAASNRAGWLARAKYHASGVAIGLAATLVNPHGILLHHHIQSDFANPYLVARTNEWLSPDFHSLYGRLFLLVIAAILLLLSLSRRRLAWPRLLLVIFMLGSALFAQRNIPLFALVVLPVLALEFDDAWRGLSVRGLDRVRRVFQHGEARAAPGRWFGAFALVMLLLGFNDGRVAGFQAVTDRFDPEVFPVGAVAWARQAGIDGRMFHAFTWGGYMLYAWPDQPIFIDGMTDFFGEDLARDYLTIANVRRGWDRKLRDYRITVAMIPANSALAYALEREGWLTVHADDTAVILRRPEWSSP